MFGLPFAGFGMFMAYRVVAMLWLASQAAGWAETPATILSAKLEGGKSKRVVAEYAYTFDGREYRGDRVGLDDTADNISRFHRDMYERLDAARDAGDTVTCYVDPEDPSQALLHREVRPVLLLFHVPFVVCFGLAGFGIIGGAIYATFSHGRKQRRHKQHPDEPWRVREDWAAGEIRSGGWGSIAGVAGFALFWNALVLPFPFLMFAGEKEVPWWVGLLIGAFVLIGLGMAGATVYQIVRLLRYGRSTFRMANVPGVVGGELAGVVLAPEGVRPPDGFRVTLACQETRPARGSDNGNETVTIWEDERVVDQTLHDSSGKRGVPVRFVIPSNKRATAPDAKRPINWKLTVHAETPGPDYKAEFDVPVFVTADSLDDIDDSPQPLTEYERDVPLAETLADDRILYEELTPDSLRINSPPFQTPISALVFFVVGVVFVGVAIGVGGWAEGVPRYLIPPISGLIGLAMVWGGLSMLFSCSELRIDRDRWWVRSGWYGFRGAGHEFAAGDIRSITSKTGMSSTSGNKTKQWNHLQARLPAAKKVTLVRNLTDRNAERRLKQELKERAGLEQAEKPTKDIGWSDYEELDDEPLSE